MRFFLARLLLNALAVLAVAYLVPGVFVRSFWVAVLAAFVLGIANALLRPILLILSLPINILTLGLFTLVINALMFWFASSIVSGFFVQNFRAAFLGALVFWVVSWFASSLLPERA
jgi:putative membrane protein